MKTKETFLQHLKDTSKRENVYNNFLNKYHNTFDTVISIQYSDKKYECINIGDIFYKDFQKYVVDQLEITDRAMSVDSWVLNLAKKRAKDISKEVADTLMNYVVTTGGSENWRIFFDLLGNEYKDVLNKTLDYCFRDSKYQQFKDGSNYRRLKDDAKDIFFAAFFEDKVCLNTAPVDVRKKNEEDGSADIDNVNSYLVTWIKNKANSKRKEIDLLLGISNHNSINSGTPGPKEIDEEDGGDILIHDGSNVDNSIRENGEFIDGDTEETEKPNVVDNSSEEVVRAAKGKVKALLNLFPQSKRSQAYLLHRIVIEDRTNEEMAKELNCELSVLYNRKRQAMITLTLVSLQHNIQECKKNFIKYEKYLENEYHKEILNAFLLEKTSVKQLATSFNKRKGDIYKDIALAYEEIVDIINNETKIKVRERKEKRKEITYITDKDIEVYEKEEQRNEALRSQIKLNA